MYDGFPQAHSWSLILYKRFQFNMLVAVILYTHTHPDQYRHVQTYNNHL